jgi:cAMP-binding proteins - catabolite gene activator and regulatory subunit of cAMP-dependent protein kinases
MLPRTPQNVKPTINRLLAQLCPEAQDRIFPHLRQVYMQLGDVIYEAGEDLDYVYFPVDNIISLLYVMSDGGSAEIAVVGFEGVVGIAVFMGGESTPSRAVTQSAGWGIPSSRPGPQGGIRRAFRHAHDHAALHTGADHADVTDRGVATVTTPSSSNCRRWLLLSLDRLPTNQLTMTQELIANMLGVRREGVTEAAGRLQKKGIIEYSRGHITVLDREKLEALSCECYGQVKRETDRLQSFPEPLGEPL